MFPQSPRVQPLHIAIPVQYRTKSIIMKRLLLTIPAFLLCCVAAAITLNGVNYSIDTLAQYPVGPGAMYYQLRMSRAYDGTGRIDAYLMTVDTRNPYVRIEQVLGKDQLVGTERVSAMAERSTTTTHVVYGGVNGDFFVTQGDVGRPTGLTVVNNELAYTPSNNRRLGGIDEQMRAVIGTKMEFIGSFVLPDTAYPPGVISSPMDRINTTIAHVNYTRDVNELVLYNEHNGATTGTNRYGTELLVELLPGETWKTTGTMRALVTAKEVEVGSMVIPKGKAVLSAHGARADMLNYVEVGDTVEIRLQLQVDGQSVKMAQCIGGDNYALIVKNGMVEQSNYWDELHPRTAFGASQANDTLFFLVVDGRGQSAGCTTKVLGEIIHYYGAHTAVNWDGGGSSCMYIRPFGQVNNGSDGSERAVGNAMYAVAEVPEADDAIAAIAPYQPIYRLPRYGIAEPKFLGYNRYGVLIDTCVQGVQLQCEASLGTIMPDGRFLASGAEGGVLTAVLPQAEGDDVSCPIQIRLIASAPVAFRMDSLLLDKYHDYRMVIQSRIQGHLLDLLPAALTWRSLDENVATVDSEGVVHGVDDGRTAIIGTVGDFADTLYVRVANPAERLVCWDDFTQHDLWAVSATTDFNPVWNGTNISFNYVGGRSPYVRLERDAPIMAVPDTIRIPIRTDALVQKIIVGIRPNHATLTQNITLFEGGLPQAVDTVMDISVRDVFGEELAIYPLHFDFIKFFLDSKTAKQQQTLEMNGIWLISSNYTDTDNALEASKVDADMSTKLITPQGLYIRHGDAMYNVSGIPLGGDAE